MLTQDDLFIVTTEVGGPYIGLWDMADEVTRRHPPSVGVAVHAEWPATAHFPMERSLPGLVVPDFINNAFGYLMVSTSVKAFFVEALKEAIEWLPFKIVNHKGSALPDTYWVANVLATLDCVDVPASNGRPDALYPGTYDLFRDLHLDYARLPDDSRIFRLSVFPEKILIHKSIKEDIERRNFTGAVFKPPVGRVHASTS
jgi:hypothetical protein